MSHHLFWPFQGSFKVTKVKRTQWSSQSHLRPLNLGSFYENLWVILDEFYYRWFENSVIEIEKAASITLMFNHLKWNPSKWWNRVSSRLISVEDKWQTPEIEEIIKSFEVLWFQKFETDEHIRNFIIGESSLSFWCMNKILACDYDVIWPGDDVITSIDR